MCLDEVKLHSDDAFFTEDHVTFLLDKYRVFLLKQRYSDIKKQIPDSNYQTICLELQDVTALPGDPFEVESSVSYLKSKEKVPSMMKIGSPKIYPHNYFPTKITLVDKERILFVGYNKYMKNIIYSAKGYDSYLYFKMFDNKSLKEGDKVHLLGIFEDPKEAFNLQCSESTDITNLLDKDFPLEEGLIPPLIELVVKELLGAVYRPEDSKNNANDDLAEVNIKS